MPDREDYLGFLSELGLDENDVAPMFEMNATELARSLPAERRDGLVKVLLQMMLQARDGDTEARKLLEGIATTFTSNTNVLISGMFSELCGQFRRAGINVPAQIFAGVYPMPSFNAAAIRRGDGALILVDNGCFALFEAAVDYYFTGGWEPENQANLLAQMIGRYADSRTLPSARERITPPVTVNDAGVTQVASAALVSSAERFILAHELGHIVRGHQGFATPSKEPESRLPVYEDRNAHDQEFEADRWAIESLLKVARSRADTDPHSLQVATAGPLIFLGLEILLEEHKRALGKRLDSHPSAKLRLDEIRLWIFKEKIDFAVPDADDYVSAFEGLAKLMLGGLDHEASLGERFVALVSQAYRSAFGKDLGLSIPLLPSTEPAHAPKLTAMAQLGGAYVIGRQDGFVRSVPSTNDPPALINVRGGGVSAVGLGPTNCAIGTYAGNIFLAKSGQLESLGRMDSAVTALCVEPKQEWLYAGSDNGYIQSYMLFGIPVPGRLEPIRRKRPLLIPVDGSAAHDCVLSLAADESRRYLASSGFFDGKIIIWDRSTSTALGEPISLGRANGPRGCRALSWLGGRLLAGGMDGLVRSVDPTTGKFDYEVSVGSSVITITSVNGGEVVLAAGQNGEVVAWRTSSPDELRCMHAGETLVGICYRDGSVIAITERGSVTRLSEMLSGV